MDVKRFSPINFAKISSQSVNIFASVFEIDALVIEKVTIRYLAVTFSMTSLAKY